MGGGRLEGRVALVTGASRGFGRAIALAYAREGARVAVNYFASPREADEVVAQAQKLGSEAFAIRGDVAQDADARALIAGTVDRFGQLDVLVNNAGIMVRGPLLEVPVDGYRRMLDINVTGTIQCARHALPVMIPRRYGRIINLSTQLAQRAVGSGGFAAYAATKGAVESLTRVILAAEEAGYLTGQIVHPSGGWVSG
jgi:3-oxoacyl-[acyl-carrier protein] reductase